MSKQANRDDTADITDVKASTSFLNAVLWFLGLASIVLATLVGQFAAYWQQLNDVWVRIGVSGGLVVLGLVFLLLTIQGRGFFQLLKDVQVELRRVTWPSRNETTSYTWRVLVGIIFAGFLIYFLDIFASLLVKPFIN